MNRNKIYYPKSHIIEHLHTTGKEWMLEDGTEYVGFYHRYIDGLVLTLGSYSRTQSKKLVPYVDKTIQPEYVLYDAISKNPTYTEQPVHRIAIPTLEDYYQGFVLRYFIQRRNYFNYLDIIEINRNQYQSWKRVNSGIDETLYTAIELQWKLTGPLHDVKDPLEYGVADTNQRIVELNSRQLPNLKRYLTDFTELSIHSPYTSKDIKKLFGVVA